MNDFRVAQSGRRKNGIEHGEDWHRSRCGCHCHRALINLGLDSRSRYCHFGMYFFVPPIAHWVKTFNQIL